MTAPLVTRSDCGLRAVDPRKYSRIAPQGITVHWSGPSPWPEPGRFDRRREPAIWRGDQAYHMDSDAVAKGGAVDIAYTSGVGPSGVRYEGRPGWARTAANGSDDGNTVSLAACYLAGVGDPLTDEAKVGFLDEAVRLGVPLRWVHRHWFNTQCPGDALVAWAAAGFPPPGLWHAPQPQPVILPPRPVVTEALTEHEGDDGPMARKTFDCGHLDGDGCGAVIFDGHALPDPGISHFEAIRWEDARDPNVVGSYPPADHAHWPLPHVGWQNRGGFVAVEFFGGVAGAAVSITLDVPA